MNQEGIFTKWQPHYADKQIATFPVGEDKKPQIRRWNQLGLSGSAKLAQRFTQANALGFQAGPRSQVTILDIDTHDDAILAEALRQHGKSPFIVRTGRGYHAYYRHAGERRHVRPYENRPVDILGGGYVVAPPSISTKGSYEIIEGTLDDLANLTDPRRAGWPDCTTFPDQGGRKNTLYRFALEQAIYADDYETLLDVVRTRNMDCDFPLPQSSTN